jgi:DNA-binding response OmpR family regulator
MSNPCRAAIEEIMAGANAPASNGMTWARVREICRQAVLEDDRLQKAALRRGAVDAEKNAALLRDLQKTVLSKPRRGPRPLDSAPVAYEAAIVAEAHALGLRGRMARLFMALRAEGGKVVSYDRLYAILWPGAVVDCNATLRHAVSSLRVKLPAGYILRLQRGFGYAVERRDE